MSLPPNRMSVQLACILVAAVIVSACHRSAAPEVATADASAERGREAIIELECGACHYIPGVPRAHGRVGPALKDFQMRPYIAGSMPNDPSSLVRWLIDPPAKVPETAMPGLGIDERTARDIAAYLYSLE